MGKKDGENGKKYYNYKSRFDSSRDYSCGDRHS